MSAEIGFLLIPAGLVAAALAEPITRLVYERGAFTSDRTPVVAGALAAFSVGLVFNGWMLLLEPGVLRSAGRTGSPRSSRSATSRSTSRSSRRSTPSASGGCRSRPRALQSRRCSRPLRADARRGIGVELSSLLGPLLRIVLASTVAAVSRCSSAGHRLRAPALDARRSSPSGSVCRSREAHPPRVRALRVRELGSPLALRRSPADRRGGVRDLRRRRGSQTGPWAGLDLAVRAARRSRRVANGQRVIDVGCGPGALTAELVGRVGAAHVAAVDPSEPFVVAARERHPGVAVQRGAGERLPFAERTVRRSAARSSSSTSCASRSRGSARWRASRGVTEWWRRPSGISRWRAPLSVLGCRAEIRTRRKGRAGFAGRHGPAWELFAAAGLRRSRSTGTLSASSTRRSRSGGSRTPSASAPPAHMLRDSIRDARDGSATPVAPCLPEPPFTLVSTAWAVILVPFLSVARETLAQPSSCREQSATRPRQLGSRS